MTTFNEAFAHHIGFSVFDAYVTAARYTQMLGREVQASIYELEDIYGRPAKLKICYGAIAGLAIEIIEPFEGDTPHATFLREHSEGIQHIGFWVPNVRAATADLVGKGSRVEWVYAREGDDAAKAHAAAQLTPASTVGDALGAVSERGLSYVDIKEGGTAIEFLGPYAPRRHLPQGWAARGLGGVDPGRSPRWTNWRLRRASRASRVPTHSARLLGACGGPHALPACPPTQLDYLAPGVGLTRVRRVLIHSTATAGGGLSVVPGSLGRSSRTRSPWEQCSSTSPSPCSRNRPKRR